ncbi:MAG TPA: hypothetical protein VME66_10680 [Candidatus Acidoferrales bacterium]|nr:hypothetical protein [Candidatus Acidoferrales bacterium]
MIHLHREHANRPHQAHHSNENKEQRGAGGSADDDGCEREAAQAAASPLGDGPELGGVVLELVSVEVGFVSAGFSDVVLEGLEDERESVT